MLGVLAHGLQLVLVLLGLAGVVALLLPRSRHPPLSRPACRPPSTSADLPWRDDRDPAPWRAIAAVSSLAAAVAHATVFPDRLEEAFMEGAFFFVVAVCQALWAVQLSRSATQPRLISGALGNLVLIGIWAGSRTIGMPFGPHRESVGAWDAAAVAWELCVLIVCLVGLRTGPDDHLQPMGRLGLRTWAWVLLSLAILTFLSITAHRE